MHLDSVFIISPPLWGRRDYRFHVPIKKFYFPLSEKTIMNRALRRNLTIERGEDEAEVHRSLSNES